MSILKEEVEIEDIPEVPTDPFEQAVAAKNRGNKYFLKELILTCKIDNQGKPLLPEASADLLTRVATLTPFAEKNDDFSRGRRKEPISDARFSE